MFLLKFYVILVAISCVLIIGLDAYPTINIRRFFDSAVQGIYKKSDITFPQIDEDVLELEHLKRNPDDEITDNTSPQSEQQQHEHSFEKQHETTDVEIPLTVGLLETDTINQSETLPELERQLESATTSTSVTVTPTKSPVDSIVGQSEQEQGEGIQGGHRPPMLPHNDGGKAANNNHQQVESPSGADVTAGVPSMAKTAESLLKHDGQYSAFDMAQYVFWTGDEVGVARAVEEFIEQGLMSRENALKFLREIRTGIEYLQRSYSRRIFPEEILENNVKKSYPPPGTTTSTTTTSTTTTTTEKPFPDIHLDVVSENQRNNHNLQKTIDSISMWNKLQEMNNDDRQELTDYDESAGRAKIAEFLYKEYTLEEILYNLAKVMFAQSLSRGSGEAHHELQKLTDFLEREGNRGVIPLDLQKKVLHVLLTALSDTLNEHPELLPAARINLGGSLNTLPLRNYGAFN